MKKHKCCEHVMKKGESKQMAHKHEHEGMKKYIKEKVIKDEMHEFKEGNLHSGSKKGPVVTNPKQAIAISLSVARKKSKKK